MEEFRFDPDTYLEMVTSEVPDYVQLQEEVAGATGEGPARSILDLGTGTGETARRLLERHPGAALTGLDENRDMLARARQVLPEVRLLEGRLEDPLPAGPFDLVVSVLAVHHLPGSAKGDLFGRIAESLEPGGRFVLGDVVVPENPADVVTPIDGVHDVPSRIDEQLGWLAEAGLHASIAWSHRDLAVLVGDR